MEKGIVLFFDVDVGYGFITPEDEGREVFVHHTGLLEPIKKGDTVEYKINHGEKGAFAIQVKLR